MAPAKPRALLCVFLFALLAAAQTTIDVPFFGGITSQQLSGSGEIYSDTTYITLCSSTSYCDYDAVAITLSTYEGWTSTYTYYGAFAVESTAWYPFASTYGTYDCTLESSTAVCNIGTYEETSTSWTDVTLIPVTLASLDIVPGIDVVTYSDFETVTITADSNAANSVATLVLPIADAYTYGSNTAQATVLDVKDSVMTLAFDNADQALYPYTEQTLTIGPHTWHISKTKSDYSSSTRIIDCSFDAAQFQSVGDMTCSISNGGAGAYSPGITKTTMTDVPQVTVTLVEGAEKLLSTSTTAGTTPSNGASSTSEASAGATATPGAGPTSSGNPFATAAPSATPDVSAGILPANASLLAIAAAMLVGCLF